MPAGLQDFYVYVYIDPRNYEEFYYGKGRGARRHAHLVDETDSEKVARIRAIRREGLEPIVRTIAAGLTEQDALLIETTLIWKLGKNLTNLASGHFVSLFRPHNTLHKELPGFDFQNGIYLVNVGEGPTRNWDDCQRLGFLAAGGDPKWSTQLRRLTEGDVVVAYLKSRGYVGVGTVTARAVPYLDYRHQGRLLKDFGLVEPNIDHDAEDPALTEYVLGVDWAKSFPREGAKWQPLSKLFTTQLIRASLEGQPQTVAFIEDAFEVNLRDLADQGSA
ncbi:LEM-3-like GIY-YIG domain-containing protein [Pedococcus soli]